MVDYVKALRQGLSAADSAEVARRQVEEVFAELNRQVQKGSQGKIGIVIGSALPAGEALAQYLGIQPRNTDEDNQAIFAVNQIAVDCPKQELARWYPHPAGFPCKLAWGGVEYTCEDRRGLEKALEELLGDWSTGKKLQQLLAA